MTVEESLFKEILTETAEVLGRDGFPNKVDYLVVGRMNTNRDHKAQLLVMYGGTEVLSIDFPIRGYSKQVDVIKETHLAEKHLFKKALVVLGANGLVPLILATMTGRPAMRRKIPVGFPDGDHIVPFSDN